VNRLHALRGLHGERRNRSHAIAIVRRKRLQVRGHTRATRRIESGNRQKNWGSVVRMIIQNDVPSARGTKAGPLIFRAGRQRKMYAYCGITRKKKFHPQNNLTPWKPDDTGSDSA
jgi:hypothetical protein